MLTSNEIMSKLLEVESQNSPLFYALNSALEKALQHEAEMAKIESLSKAKQDEINAEVDKKLAVFHKLAEISFPRLAIASVFGTAKAVEHELKKEEPVDDSAEEFEIITNSCTEDKQNLKYIQPEYTELGNLAIKMMKIDDSLLAAKIKELQPYKILEKKYLDLESRTIFKDKIPQVSNVLGMAVPQYAPNLKMARPWITQRLLDKYPEFKEIKVDEDWKLLPAIHDKCKELRGCKY